MSTNQGYQFPFGRPVKPCAPSADSRRKIFILGAYPSALHVRWSPPKGSPGGKISAIPVDNEPEPFWDGSDADERVAQWMRDVGFMDSWGQVDAAPGLNGASGVWVEVNILQRCGVPRADAWITDCLNTYRVSASARKALAERFAPFAKAVRVELPRLPPHPTQAQIITEALAQPRLDELKAELRTAAPEEIVTLGNAALRVMREMVDEILGTDPGMRLRVEGYGSRCDVLVDGRTIAWYPVCHPAAPRAYQEAHKHWTCGGANGS